MHRYNPKRDITFLPMSGLLGVNIIKGDPKAHPWYSGPTLFEVRCMNVLLLHAAT